MQWQGPNGERYARAALLYLAISVLAFVIAVVIQKVSPALLVSPWIDLLGVVIGLCLLASVLCLFATFPYGTVES